MSRVVEQELWADALRVALQGKYTTGLKEHTQTMTHMQRELESLRASEKALRNKLRDMELDNDDLEKAERSVQARRCDGELFARGAVGC